eukprot:TRINITY_DN1931_c0_g1_i4.p1 TRINITY_DN1931_c0_g1~~TRINITY_DN1931_c0_g1_i4.p1  ORF type:complete len:205 (+),score=68.47 TRINITY_DN1931_c0_g1_i4:175-789(+)
MEGLKPKIEELLYKPGPLANLLAKAEKKTGLDRLLLCGLGVTFITFWLCLGYGAELVCGVIGFLYPAYESVKALHESGREIEKRWLTYWVVFAFFHVLEFFSDHLVWWVPLYWLVKTIFLVWCMAPINKNGSAVMYELVIQPLYTKYHANIDTAMDKAATKAGGLLEKAKEKVKEAADNQKSGLLDMAVEKVKDAASELNLKTD